MMNSSLSFDDSNSNNNFNKYTSMFDVIRGYFVPSLDERICDGLEIFHQSDEENFSTQLISSVKRCMDVTGSAVKYFLNDNVIPCVLNSIILNNRLNKVSRDLDESGIDKNFLRFINFRNYIYGNDYSMEYTDDDDEYNQSISESNRRVAHSTGNYDDDYYDNNNNDEDGDTSRVTGARAQSCKNREINNTNLQLIVTNGLKGKFHHTIELPCNYPNLLHHIVELIDSSAARDARKLDERFLTAVNDICRKINEKLAGLEKTGIEKCRLYCDKQNEIIYVELKMMNTDGSKKILYNDQLSRWDNPQTRSNSTRIMNLELNSEQPLVEVERASFFRERHPSFATINAIPPLKLQQVSTPNRKYFEADGGGGGDDDDDDDDDDDNDSDNSDIDYSNEEGEDENDLTDCLSCPCSVEDIFNAKIFTTKNRCDSKCSCVSSCQTIPNPERSSSEISVDDFDDGEARISAALIEILEASDVNRKAEVILTQTSDWKESSGSLMDMNDSFPVSDELSQSEMSENLSIVSFDINEREEKEEIEEEVEETNGLEKIEEVEETMNNELKKFINDLIELILRFESPTRAPPPSLRSSEIICVNDEIKKSEKTAVESSSKSTEQVEKILSKKSSICTTDKRICQGSSSVFVSPCRHLRGFTPTPSVIKCHRKYSKTSCNSEVDACYEIHNSKIKNNSSMNNLYSVQSHRRRGKICYCEKEKLNKSASKIHYNEKNSDQYSQIINKHVKKILSAIRKRFQIVFASEIYNKLKFLIKRKLNKLVLENWRKKHVARAYRMKYQRQPHDDHSGNIKQSINSIDSNFLLGVNNYSMNKHKSKYTTRSTPYSHEIYSPRLRRVPYNYTDQICTNRKSELSDWYQCSQSSSPTTNRYHQGIRQNELINNAKCSCECCCKSIETINYYQSTDNSINENGTREYSSRLRRTKRDKSCDFYEKKKVGTPPSCLSQSSINDYFCCYHKIFFALKKFDSLHNLHRFSTKDELKVDCGKCINPADRNFRKMINHYVNMCKIIRCSELSSTEDSSARFSPYR